MHSARHTAVFRCIHEQSRCKRLHQVLGSPWAQSAISREWKHTHREESKTSNRMQCSNQQGGGPETRFSKDNWKSTYFKIFWMSWNWPLYSREYLLYWLHWHLVVETSSLTVKKRKSASQYYLLWMWRHVGTQHWSCLSKSTNYENSPASGSKIQNTGITSHSSQHRMNCQVHHGRFGAIPILDPVNVEEA